ncbi:MAG: hypothetical protein ACR2QC_02000 [Gammaproteobacteria bacterium]
MKQLKSALFALAAAVFAVSGGVAVASDANDQYSTFSPAEYENSCGSFLRVDRKGIATSDYREYNKYFNWITGFMTAAGLYNDTQKSLGEVADMPGIMHLIRKYCEGFPLNDLANAAQVVVELHLLPKAGER